MSQRQDISATAHNPVRARTALYPLINRFGRFSLLLTGGALVFAALAYLMLTNQNLSRDREYSSQQSPPLTERLLWIDVDAARRDFMFDPKVMPTVVSLVSRGASGTALISGIPSSLAAIKAWTTGAGFSPKDIPSDFQGIDPNLDSLFWRARLRGRYVAFAGPPEWVNSFRDSFNESFTHYNRPPGPASNDAHAHANALRFLHDNRYHILVVHYDNADMVGHVYGPLDGHYADALRRIDSYIRELLEQVPPEVTVLVAGDHGMSDQGGHAESIPIVVRPPFVFAGKGINHVSGLEIDARDFAPTLAALLGLDFPMQSEGRLASEILDAPFAEKASWEIAYASAKLHAMESAGIRDAIALSAYRAAQTAQDGARYTEAVSLGREAQGRSNLQLKEAESRHSLLFLIPIALLGFAVCLVLLHFLHESRTEADSAFEKFGGGARAYLGGSTLAFIAGTSLIWFLSEGLRDFSIRVIPAFRLDFLIAHWKRLSIALPVLCLVLACLWRAMPTTKISSEARAILFGLSAAVFCSFGHPFDVWLWTLSVAAGILGLRAILFHREQLVEAGAYGVLLLAGLFARHVENRQTMSGMVGKSWLGAHFGIWACLASVAAVIFAFGFLAQEVCPQAEGGSGIRRLAIYWRALSTPAWLLLLVAIGSQLVRLMGWLWAASPLFVLIAGCLLWQLIAIRRDAGQCQLSLSMAILAASPIVFPAHYIPFLCVALVALCLWGKRIHAEEESSAFVCASLFVAGIIWLFLGLNGDFYPQLADIRRQQLLNPLFQYTYLSAGRVVLLEFVQLLLPTLAVVSWVGYALRKKAATWLGTMNLVHLFFWCQMLSLAVYVHYRANESNSLHQILAQLLIVLFLYLTFSLAGLTTARLIHGPQTRPVSAAQGEQVWTRLGSSGVSA